MLNLEKDRTLSWLVAAIATLGVGSLSAMPPEFGDDPGAPWEAYEESEQDDGFWDSWMGDEEQESARESIEQKRDEYEDAWNEKKDEYEDTYEEKRDQAQDWFEDKRSETEEMMPEEKEEAPWWKFW